MTTITDSDPAPGDSAAGVRAAPAPPAGGVPDRGFAGSREHLRARWLVSLRWGWAAGQFAVIAAAHLLSDAPLPIARLVLLASLLAATNAALEWRLARGRLTSAVTGPVLAFDTLQLTALLWSSGGASNPFSVFYLVGIVVAAVTLGSRWTWFLAALAVSCYASLFMAYVPGPGSGAHAGHEPVAGNDAFGSHLRTMWVALTLAAGLTAYFVTRLSRTIERNEAELEGARDLSARHERLAALNTLAAGAAHELGTPLGTMAVVIREIQHEIERRQAAARDLDEVLDDVKLLGEELVRCRSILDRMTIDSGELAGEMPAGVRVAELLDEVRVAFHPEEASRIDVKISPSAPVSMVLPRRAMVAALRNLVKNALDASPPGSRIDLVAGRDEASGMVRLAVVDRGGGMSPEVIAHASEPFFTTRAPGEGMGLGLFLTRALAERLGGRLELESSPGTGTVAAILLVVAP